MTPAARIAAAIEILDQIAQGELAERCLTAWARGHRFAGSKDRAAIRDHVYDALRCRGSFGRLGGGTDGRALMIGALRATEQDVDAIFSGLGHAPAPLTPKERQVCEPLAAGDLADLDWPDWLRPQMQADLGLAYDTVSQTARQRAPVFLRVNRARTDVAQAQARLKDDGIETVAVPLAQSALQVIAGARRLRQTEAYLQGVVELQDAASQAAVEALPLDACQTALDFCAGGGGKALAMAARAPDLNVTAHDANPARMKDLAVRADRAGTPINQVKTQDLRGVWDLVLVDAPCSGSGTWRRTPDAKWRLTQSGLDDLVALQAGILKDASSYVAPNGMLVYMTCSMLRAENHDQVSAFTASGKWDLFEDRAMTPVDGGDGFYYAILKRCV
ncbi:RsmB/NOP family class I SAM-dependent RNA methyltransferase [Rhodobacteraceae bacterium]|nr:RsmB/NOP family class I SAM-dependent RNA methyltransferase [Paracoccaceae bacterium]